MSLRDALKTAVARCTPQHAQAATSAANDATAHATSVQPPAAKPHETWIHPATVVATALQQAWKSSATPAESCRLHTLGDATRNSRPFRLNTDQAEACHATAWTDDEIATFVDRHTRFMKAGFGNGDADDLAELLVLRDREGDDRAMCLECTHLLRSGRCASAMRGEIAGANEKLAPVVTVLMRCEGFTPKEAA